MRFGAAAALLAMLIVAPIQGPVSAQDAAGREGGQADRTTSFAAEAGYVLAMETAFTGLSLLGSRNETWGPSVTGSFDVLMAIAGLHSASRKESGPARTGQLLLAAGFAAKAAYGFHLGRNQNDRAQFWSHLVAYNTLVFVGYFLDTL
jgi:hypothetical protein